MSLKRIITHPILDIPNRTKIKFYWNNVKLEAFKGEMISSALLANGIEILGHHHKDGSPQGMFCANGQCSQCMVLLNGISVKSCMVKIEKGMKIKPLEGLPSAKYMDKLYKKYPIERYNIPVLIVGGGPAGLSAAIELGKVNIKTIIVDDKDSLGGKLALQTHKFFGSVEDSYAGTRGFEIGNILEKQLKSLKSVNIWNNSTVVGIFSDGVVGVFQNNKTYFEIKPNKLLLTTGAREKMLSFPGNTLPGVYGAGAFQTVVNRDFVKISKKILIIGGGNVGLIAGYHALQAGIQVKALIEAMPNLAGYKVHADKLARMGVPIFTRHTIVSAGGKDHVTHAIIAEVDNNFKVKTHSYKKINVDTILIAVGLAEVDELYLKAKNWNLDVYSAGDCNEIAEASSAIFNGKIEGYKIAKALGNYSQKTPSEWIDKSIILKSKPSNPIKRDLTKIEKGVFPIFHCYQEIPCNPCTSVCPENVIKTANNKITGLPYIENMHLCKGCMACVAICPGLAITLLDYRKDANNPSVTIPYELQKDSLRVGDFLFVTDVEGKLLGKYIVNRVIINKKYPNTLLVQINASKKIAKKIAGIQIKKEELDNLKIYEKIPLLDEAIICRCERVSAGEIRKIIRNGVTDLNQIKAITRVGMGACGSKTCRPMIWRIFREEGIKMESITDRVDRPLFVEVPMGTLAGIKEKYNNA